jgi:hypothetical protein
MDYKKELKEALDALDSAQKTLDDALDSLGSAKGWGVYDTFFKGGFLSSAIKHSRMNSAEKEMKDLSKKLEKLQKELKDVNIELAKFKGTSSFNKTLDIFFDNIISDLSSQSKINENIKNLRELKKELGEVEKRLKEELKEA